MIQSSEHMLRWIDQRRKIPVFKKGNLPDVSAFYDTSDDGMEEIEELFEKYEARGFFEIDMKYVKDSFVTDVKADDSAVEKFTGTMVWQGQYDKV